MKCFLNTEFDDEAKIYSHVVVIFIFSILTSVNILFFFFIKNSTHELSIQLIKINNEIINETKYYSMLRASFNKKYDVKTLKEMVKDKLHLKQSNVKQIKDIQDIIAKKR